MRNNKILLTAALLFCATMMPLRAQLYHQLGLYSTGGWSSQASSSDFVGMGRGYHTALGFNYEFQLSHFIFDTGVGFQWQSAGVSVADDEGIYCGTTDAGEPVWRAQRADILSTDPSLLDTQGEPFRMRIITQERTDYMRMGNIQIPVLAGGIYGHLYFLGGLKLSVPLFGRTRTRAHFTTQGIYDRYNEPVTHVNFHGFFNDYPAFVKGPKLQTLPVDLMASAEIGYNFSITEDMLTVGERVVRETRLRLALFVDYSLLNLHKNTTLTPIVLDSDYPYDIDRFTTANVLNTERTLNTYLANVNLGVKFTVLFGNKQRFLCHSCESAVEAGINSPHSGYRSRDNRQTDTRLPQTTPDVQK